MRTGLVSNSWGTRRYPRELLDELFDGVVISGEEGMRKPDPRMYALGAERIGLPRRACVYVDDLALNLEPAGALGMATVHHTEAATTVAELERLLGVPRRPPEAASPDLARLAREPCRARRRAACGAWGPWRSAGPRSSPSCPAGRANARSCQGSQAGRPTAPACASMAAEPPGARGSPRRPAARAPRARLAEGDAGAPRQLEQLLALLGLARGAQGKSHPNRQMVSIEPSIIMIAPAAFWSAAG